MQDVVTFDEVEPLLSEIFEDARLRLEGLRRLTAIRDLFGRVRLVVDPRPTADSPLDIALREFARMVQDRLRARAFPPDQAFFYEDELASELREILDTARMLRKGPPEFRLLDRQTTALAWGIVREPPVAQAIPRLAFYSLKGGVGRSTAVAVTALHLARQGRNVVVFDLDLEAPGLSTSLLPAERRPEFGLADWFVEDALGQGDYCLPEMVASSPLAHELRGQVLVVPSHGAIPGDYLAKLGRCYLDLPRQNAAPERWQDRLVRVIEVLEQRTSPDVTLLDVRAGLPDLAAVPTTDLGAEVLLFALDTDQTWAGYKILFDFWRRTDLIRRLRERLHLVAAMVPETDRDAYLSRFREHAWDLFREFAYDEAAADIPPVEDIFTFDLLDDDAPHAPIPVYWNRGFASLAHLRSLDETLVETVFGHFFERIATFVSRDVEVRA